MDRQQVLHNFFASFGVPAYDQYSVPDDKIETFPRITYESAVGDLFDQTAISADLWDRSSSWATVAGLFNQISDAIGIGGITFPCDGGGLWIKKGQPFMRRMDDGDDSSIRRMHLNLYVEFITT